MSDLISRQAAIDAVNGIINRFEQILRDIRESKVDDSVCGMCEYDGAYIGQSGDWCNECPGFDKDDCFKLSDKCKKRWLKSVDLPSAQAEPRWIPCSERLPSEGEYVLVTENWNGYVRMWRLQSIDNEPTWEVDGMDWYNADIDEAVAWMPLPEPWKGVDGDHKRN